MDFMYTGQETFSKFKVYAGILVIGILFGIAIYHVLALPVMQEPLSQEIRSCNEKTSILEKEIQQCLNIKSDLANS